MQSVGQIHFTVKFMPFEEPKFDDDIELTPVKTGVPASAWLSSCGRGKRPVSHHLPLSPPLCHHPKLLAARHL